MNTLKTIYDKLGDKTELAKHEVELGLVDDLKKDETLIVSQLKTIEDLLGQVVNLEDKAKGYKNELMKNFDRYNSLISKITISYKELGLDWNQSETKTNSLKTIKRVGDLVVKYKKYF